MKPPVLVACPTNDDKLYSRQRYVDAIEALTYRPSWPYCVDTTGWIGPWDGEPSIAFNAWRMILSYAQEYSFPYILSLDSDVIAPPNMIETLMGYMADDVFAVYHALPFRGQDRKNHNAAGLALFQTRYVADGFREWESGEHDYQYVEWMLAGVGGDGYAPRHGLQSVKVDLLPVTHLDR